MSGFIDDIKEAFSRRDNGLIQLILINVFVFLGLLVLQVSFSLSGKESYYTLVLDQLALKPNPAHLLYKPWTLLTYCFVHQNILHILFNMLFLFWFGQLVQEYLGSRRLVSLYMLGGVVGGLTFAALYNLVPLYRHWLDMPNVGASGAVYAVMLGAATLLPNYTFHVLIIGPVRIKYIAAFFVVVSFAQIPGSNAGGNITHLSGALFGYLYIRMLRRGTDLGQPVEAVLDFFKRLFSREPRPRMKVKYRSQTRTTYTAYSTTAEEFPDDDEIDAILDKISKSGYESLTREEKQKLYKASQKN
ncbi:MAG: rhomboid family intramembrane serine protease [Siphonobacter aquaeclarae]|nr:rhomboid family intramembrane serine protease [Siphonobacter aquaeclarae]